GEPSYMLDEETQTIVDKARTIAQQNKVRMVQTVVHEGKPAQVLIDYAKSHEMDLLVVGSRGLGALEAAVLGSVLQKASQLADGGGEGRVWEEVRQVADGSVRIVR